MKRHHALLTINCQTHDVHTLQLQSDDTLSWQVGRATAQTFALLEFEGTLMTWLDGDQDRPHTESIGDMLEEAMPF